MKIKFTDLTVPNYIEKEIKNKIKEIFNKGEFINGEEVNKFEIEFAKYLGVSNCISLNSGTDALILGVRALELSSNDEIIIPANTFISTALAASENNLKPVFVDISEEDYGINLIDLKQKINNRTKAIIIVHLYGQPDKLDEVITIIKKSGKKIFLIEDCCQAHGAYYKDQKVGNYGIFSAFSFYPTKNLGAYGDGGAIVTNNKKFAKRVRLLKEYGQIKKYFYKTSGINSRLDAIQAALLRIKLKYLDSWNKLRQEKAFIYSSFLKQNHYIITPKEFKERKSIYHLYVIRTKKRKFLSKYLALYNIQTLIHYPVPLHLQKVYQYLKYKQGSLPIAERVSKEIISLPIHPYMSIKTIKYITQKIFSFYKQKQ